MDNDDADLTFDVTKNCPSDEISTSSEYTVPDKATLNSKENK